MKKVFFLFIGLTIYSVAVPAQNILVANNNPGADPTNVFTGATALQDAITAAIAGDIIYVVPSGINYGDINILKALTIFGVGIRPDSQSPNRSVVGRIYIDASNVRISGLINTFEVSLGYNTTGTISNITIENSRIRAVKMANVSTSDLSNLLVRNCVIQGTTGVGHILLRTNTGTLITNNLFITNYTNGVAMVAACCGARFEYNIFADNGNDSPYEEIVNCNFTNNIFYGVSVAIPSTSTGNIWNYNISYGSTLLDGTLFNTTTNGNSGVGNIENVDPLFVNMPLTALWDNNHDFSLSAGSPALASDPGNLSGNDIGTSGGATPFQFEANILPLIQSITIPAVVKVGDSLRVNIKAKGN